MKERTKCFWGNYIVGVLTVTALAAFVWTQPIFAQSAGWQDRWNKVLSDAKKEGSVVVMGPPGAEIRRAMTEGFQRAFPEIRIEFSGARGTALASRIISERNAGVYSVDVVVGGPQTPIRQLRPVGALDPVEPVLILPEVTNPKNWRGNGLEYVDKDKLVLVFVGIKSLPMVYDPKQAKPDEIDQLDKLLMPRWKGKILINDPSATGIASQFFHFLWRELGPEKAKDFYSKIRAHAGAIDRQERMQIEWIAQGRYAVLLAPSSGALAQLVERGIEVGVLPELKDYGSYLSASFGTVQLLNKAPHPNAATVFINWLLTKEGQIIWSKTMDHVSRRIDVPTEHLPPYIVPRPGVKYRQSWLEEEQKRSVEEVQAIKEIFGR